MIVYVESNFAIELALAQEQAPAAEAILALAERRALTLVFPAFVLSEPFSNLIRRGKQRKQVFEDMEKQVRELARSQRRRQEAAQLQPALKLFADVEVGQMHALDDAVGRLLGAATPANPDQAIFRRSLDYRKRINLSPQDAIIYATVIADLDGRDPSEAKCFVSRDIQAFDDSELKAELRQHHCQYIDNFPAGLQYIQHVLSGSAEA